MFETNIAELTKSNKCVKKYMTPFFRWGGGRNYDGDVTMELAIAKG